MSRTPDTTRARQQLHYLSNNLVEEDHLSRQAKELVWRIDQRLLDLSEFKTNVKLMQRLHRMSARAFKRFMRRAALARKLKVTEGDLR